MLAFGTVVGLIFPFFARMALDTDEAMTFQFFGMCVAAGLAVGISNFVLFKLVVSRELSRMVGGMKHVNEAVAVAEDTGEGCRDGCRLEVTSNDLIGDVTEAFNSMTEAIGRRITIETTARCLLSELSTSVELDHVSREILEALVHVVDGHVGALYADTGKKLELLTSCGVDSSDELPTTIDGGQAMAKRAIEVGKTLVLVPSRDGFEWLCASTPLGSMRPTTVIVAPLTADRRPVGLAVLGSKAEEIPEEQQLLLDTIRKQAAPYLHTAVLHQKLRDLAAVDDLTRVLNRRFGMRRLHEEFSRSIRHGVPLSVFMIDLDHFKTFNDTFGHDAGDAILANVASVLERNLRAGDVICRYGGEEFMIVAPGMGLNDAAGAAERLRRLVASAPVRWRDQELKVTISLGAASWPVARASAPDEIVSCADQALYHAKRSGRDRVSIHHGDEVVPYSALQTIAGE
jgi:diguanylate cyclase (GGDEF)-like protein